MLASFAAFAINVMSSGRGLQRQRRFNEIREYPPGTNNVARLRVHRDSLLRHPDNDDPGTAGIATMSSADAAMIAGTLTIRDVAKVGSALLETWAQGVQGFRRFGQRIILSSISRSKLPGSAILRARETRATMSPSSRAALVVAQRWRLAGLYVAVPAAIASTAVVLLSRPSGNRYQQAQIALHAISRAAVADSPSTWTLLFLEAAGSLHGARHSCLLWDSFARHQPQSSSASRDVPSWPQIAQQGFLRAVTQLRNRGASSTVSTIGPPPRWTSPPGDVGIVSWIPGSARFSTPAWLQARSLGRHKFQLPHTALGGVDHAFCHPFDGHDGRRTTRTL